jgi:hypothetical protein
MPADADRPMPATPDLDDDERATLIAVLREVVERNRHFMSPRMKRLRAIFGKLDPLPPRPQSYLPPKPPGQPSAVLVKKKGRDSLDGRCR